MFYLIFWVVNKFTISVGWSIVTIVTDVEAFYSRGLRRGRR